MAPRSTTNVFVEEANANGCGWCGLTVGGFVARGGSAVHKYAIESMDASEREAKVRVAALRSLEGEGPSFYTDSGGRRNEARPEGRASLRGIFVVTAGACRQR